MLCKKFFLVRFEGGEDVVGDIILICGSVYADSESSEACPVYSGVGTSEFFYGAFKSVVTCWTSAEFELYFPGRKVDFVVDDKNILWRDFVEVGYRSDGFSWEIHECLWFEENHFLLVDSGLEKLSLVFVVICKFTQFILFYEII